MPKLNDKKTVTAVRINCEGEKPYEFVTWDRTWDGDEWDVNLPDIYTHIGPKCRNIEGIESVKIMGQEGRPFIVPCIYMDGDCMLRPNPPPINQRISKKLRGAQIRGNVLVLAGNYRIEELLCGME